jgi:hypothetical protein
MTSPSFPSLPRREFLKLGLAGSVAAILPAGCSSYRENVKPEEEEQLQFLSVKDYAILLAAADAILPNAHGYPSHRDLGTVNKLDEELAKWEPVRSKDIPVLLRLIEHGTLIFGYSLSRFTKLSLEDRRDYLVHGWGESSLNLKRAGFVAVKGLLAFYYFSDPQVWPKLGYDGPWLGRFDIPITEIDGLPA